MADVASNSVPERLLEESFSRTFATRQVRIYPWDRLARLGAGDNLTFGLGSGSRWPSSWSPPWPACLVVVRA